MTINLSISQIDTSLQKIEKGLEQYLWLQSEVSQSDRFYEDKKFQKKYNHFYKVRRNSEWRTEFYSLMNQARIKQLGFCKVLEILKKSTGRYEASFASKLIATFDTSKPIIDSVVLKNLSMRLPSANANNRISKICKIYETLIECFENFLESDNGKYLVSEFKKKYPNAKISEVKMLDLVLWQTRT
jgi:hypothetical protein